MQQVGVIINPGSHRNKAGIAALEQSAAAAPHVKAARLDDIDMLPQILSDFAKQDVELVTVAGGDGTVQAVLTLLFRDRPFARPPLLAVLPQGMTNMISDDVGLSRRGARGLAPLLAAAKDGRLCDHVVRRPVLRMENAAGTPPQYGMFFGGAGIYRAIQACRDHVHPYRVSANAAAALTLAGIVGRWLIGGGRQNSVFRGDRISVTLDGRPEAAADYLMVLATTLEKLILGSRPFWNQGQGHLHYTTIAYPPQKLLRHARKVLFGGAHRDFAVEGYNSQSAGRIEFMMDCPFTLDGELFAPIPDRPVILTADEEASFVRL